jgi:PKD domain-containing protein/CARDB protein/matrixin
MGRALPALRNPTRPTRDRHYFGDYMKTMRVVALTAATLLSIFPKPSVAYDYSTCLGTRITWGHSYATLYPANVSFPGGFHNALDAVADAWNSKSPGSNFRFTLAYEDATTWAHPDGKSSVAFTKDGFNPGGDIAVTLRYEGHTCYGLDEVDVLFNAWYSWTSEINPSDLPRPWSSPLNLVLVGIHEFGHAFGLNHQASSLSTMNAHYPNSGPMGNANYVLPQADDVLGDRVGYGTCCSARDVYASAYRITGEDVTDIIVPPSVVYRGKQATFPFSIGNRGTTNESPVRVDFYLSTDRFIDTSDYYLGSATYSLSSGSAGTYSTTVSVPLLPPGNYYFGWVVDPLANIPEVNEENNAVALGSSTYVPDYSPPTACLTANPNYGTAPLSVTFDGTCSSDPDGQIVSYQWDFGDGSSGTGPSPQHWYSYPGHYVVTLTVTDNSGLTSQQWQNVDVADPSCPSCIE